jgi:hypothetical protein
MPRVRFEPTTAVFGRAKTVHASDRAATVTDRENQSTYSKVKRGHTNTHRHHAVLLFNCFGVHIFAMDIIRVYVFVFATQLNAA